MTAATREWIGLIEATTLISAKADAPEVDNNVDVSKRVFARRIEISIYNYYVTLFHYMIA